MEPDVYISSQIWLRVGDPGCVGAGDASPWAYHVEVRPPRYRYDQWHYLGLAEVRQSQSHGASDGLVCLQVRDGQLQDGFVAYLYFYTTEQ